MLNDKEQRALIERSRELDQASISINRQDRRQSVYRMVIDLTKGRDILDPYKISFPFKSIFMEDSTDPAAKIFVRPITDEDHQSHFTMGYKDAWSTSETIPKAFLHWEARAAKVTLIVFTDAEFRSGSQVSITSGGLSINEGATVVGPQHVTLVAGVSSMIAPQDFFRKIATIQNKTGSDIFIGADNTVNATTNEGIKIPNDGVIQWRNTGALYAFSVGGGKVSRLEEL